MAGTARQVHLGRKLRELRQARGISLRDASERLSRSRATVGHWESARTRIGQQDLIALLEQYGADEDTANQLLQLRKESHHRGWWQSYKLPEKLAPFVGFEAEAAEKFHFELGLVPGLLQTEEYAKEVHKVGRLTLPEERVREWVEVRLKRQERLNSDSGMALHAVIAEEALHRIVGSREVMIDQLEQLEELSAWPNINLRLLPYGAGAHVAMVGPIIVLRFEDADHDDIAFSDTPLGGHIIDDLRDVTELSRLFGHLHAQALPESETVSKLDRIKQAYQHAEGETL